jgi:ADP-ribosylglycohydrolase
MNVRQRFQGCILGLAIGDALGRETEFIRSREDILAVTKGGVKDLPVPPIYTDDTQMTLCIAEALIETGKDPEKFIRALGQKFIEWYDTQKDPNQSRAPGNTCLTACSNLKSGVHWEKAGIESSKGCGSAMRSAPIGLMFDQEHEIVDYGVNSSIITHPNEVAICASVGNALVTHLAFAGTPVGQWGNELVRVDSINEEFTKVILKATQYAAERRDPDFVMSEDGVGEGWCGHEAVACALFCCMTHPNSYKDAVLLAANAIGDSDSIACIAGGWMGARLGLESIPAEWVEKIENRDKLLDVANRLFAKAGYLDS